MNWIQQPINQSDLAAEQPIGQRCGAVLLALPSSLYSQTPLTVQPSTGRVGVGNTNPAYPLNVIRHAIR